MNGLITTVKFLLGFVTFVVLVAPLFRYRGQRTVTNPADDKNTMEKQGVLDALTDLDYEYETGKINDQDYQRLRSVYVKKALDLFDDEELETLTDETDSDEGDEDALEEAIKRARDELT